MTITLLNWLINPGHELDEAHARLLGGGDGGFVLGRYFNEQ